MARFSIPIRLPSLTNVRYHWRTLVHLKKKQRGATTACMVGVLLPRPPLVVTICRAGPRKLDDDNLAAACKHVRDQIADIVGLDDGSPLYTWRYEQRVGKREHYRVDVEIVARGDAK